MLKRSDSGFYEISEVCHLSFEGGSATTTAGKSDETRFYVADAVGNLLAYDPQTCEELWSLDVGGQIVASPTVASDNNEIYVNTLFDTVVVIDRGDRGEIKYSVQFDLWDEEKEPLVEGTLLSSPIGANHLAFQAGVGTILPLGGVEALFPVQTAVSRTVRPASSSGSPRLSRTRPRWSTSFRTARWSFRSPPLARLCHAPS